MSELKNEDKALRDQLMTWVSFDFIKGREGKILKIKISRMGAEYYIRYVEDKIMYEEWFYRDEITFL
jgi:hypothetical protein